MRLLRDSRGVTRTAVRPLFYGAADFIPFSCFCFHNSLFMLWLHIYRIHRYFGMVVRIPLYLLLDSAQWYSKQCVCVCVYVYMNIYVYMFVYVAAYKSVDKRKLSSQQTIMPQRWQSKVGKHIGGDNPSLYRWIVCICVWSMKIPAVWEAQPHTHTHTCRCLCSQIVRT